jgi:hypothetical protein
MTKSQEKSINYLRNLAETYLPNREIKKFEVHDHESFISLAIITGIPDDDGTLAFGMRDYCHFFIGKRGGITYPGRDYDHTKAKRFNGVYLTVANEQNNWWYTK